MPLAKPKLVAVIVGVAVLAAGGVAFMAMQKPHGEAVAAGGPGGGQRGPGGPGGPGSGMGRGGPVDVVAAETVAREFSTPVEALGTLEPRERVELSVNAADRVTGVYFEDGQRVRKGATLVTMANDEERALIEAAEATRADAVRILERNTRLSADGAVAASELEKSKATADASAANVRSLEARLRDRVLIAPFDGVLGFRRISTGAYVSPGQVVATLIDDSEMRLEFGVPSVYMKDLRKGLKIEASSADVPGKTFTGELTSIDNAIDSVTRSVKVRATLPNTSGELRAGMFMKVALSSAIRSELAVPEIAIIAEGSQTFVYVVDQTVQPAVAKKVKVTLGERVRGIVEVVDGLESGDLVVSDGVLKLRPGAPVRVQSSAPTPASLEGGEPKLAASGEGPSDKAGLRQ